MGIFCRNQFDTRVHMMASNLSWFNTAINPIIYAIMNRKFRSEYICIIKRVVARVRRCSFFSRKESPVVESNARIIGSNCLSRNISSHRVANA